MLKGAREKAQWLRALVTLKEDLCSVPSTYTVTPVSGNLMFSSDFCRHKYARGACTYIKEKYS